VISRLLKLFTSIPGIKTVNKFSGALLGLAESIIIVIIAINVMTIIPNDAVQQLLKMSAVSPHIIEEMPLAAGKLQELWK